MGPSARCGSSHSQEHAPELPLTNGVYLTRVTLDKILLKEKNMKNIAFTLMELLVVMAIITILGGDNC